MSEQAPSTQPTTDDGACGAADEPFVRLFSQALRGRRRTIGWTLDRMAQHVDAQTERTVDAATLAELEAGRLSEENRPLIGLVASSYDVDLAKLGPPRQPVIIKDAAFVIRDIRVPWYSDHIDDILVAFLEAIRTARGNKEVEVASFRRVDIDVLAEYLDRPPEFLLERLAELVGASNTRASAMTSIYLSGGQVIPTGVLEEEAEPVRSGSRLVELLQSAQA